MRPRELIRAGALFAVPALAIATLPPATASSDAHGVVVVSPHGVDSASCGASSAPCKTIDQAVANAQRGATIRIRRGVYHEQVVVSKKLRVSGRHATVDATGLTSGSGQQLNAAAVLVLPTASGSTIQGLRVHGAYGEGILVMGAQGVTVRHNRVFGNDLGTPQNTSYLECQMQGEIPGDCGEGIHLMSTTHAHVVDNVVTHNSGGVLVTDELGPASHNVVARNRIAHNLFDCGITLPSHNPNALSATGRRQPSQGGVYDNVVRRNWVYGNGLKGEGAGVLIAAAAPGMASYRNKVIGNFIAHNNLAGVTIHSHTPNQDVNGNVIRNNIIGRNNLGGDPDAGHNATTGILVFSAVVPVRVRIQGNHIHDNKTPIWTSPNVTIVH